MKRIFLILLLLGLIFTPANAGNVVTMFKTQGGGGGYATPALINSGYNTTGGSEAATLATPAKATTTGNAIIVHIVWYHASRSVSTVTDTAGNTYIRAGTLYNNGEAYIDTWISLNATGNASNIVTVTMSLSTYYLRVSMEEVSNIATSAAFDKEATGTGSSSSMTTSATSTTSQTHEYLTSAFYLEAESSGSPGTNWTENIDYSGDFYTQYRVVTSTGEYAATATASGGAGGYYGIIKTFKARAL